MKRPVFKLESAFLRNGAQHSRNMKRAFPLLIRHRVVEFKDVAFFAFEFGFLDLMAVRGCWFNMSVSR